VEGKADVSEKLTNINRFESSSFEVFNPKHKK
jgi:hypothetical protein